MSINIFLPSLPGMAAYFDADYRLIQLSIAVYLGMNAALQILVGPLSDRYGRRPVILTGLALFLVATLGCIMAPNVTVFLFFRMMQACVAVAMVLSRAVVRDLYDQDRAASMLGYVTMGMALVPMISPAIGGVLEDSFDWRANFWALFVAGLVVFILTWRDLGETARPSNNTLWGQFREYPELLTSPRFWGYCLASALGSGAFFAYLGGAPFIASEVYAMPPTETGLYLAAPAIGYFLGNWLSGIFATRVGVNRMVLAGGGLSTIGLALSLFLALTGLSGPLVFFGLMTILGVGNGMLLPSATAGMLSVRPHLAGTASGLGGAIMLGGGALLSAFSGAMLVPDSAEVVLLVIMVATSALSVAAILTVMRRERRLGL